MGVIINQLWLYRHFIIILLLASFEPILKKKLKVTLGEIKKEESKKA